MKIYISPSSQSGNIYAADKTNEGSVCFQIAMACQHYLDRQGHKTNLGVGPNKTTFKQRVEESNTWGADIHLCIHTNAGGGDGTVVFCHPKNVNNPVIKRVYNAVAAISPGEDDGIRPMNNLYEINHTNALCVYVEVEFHDRTDLANWIINHVDLIGKTIAYALCENAPLDPATKAGPAYRVITGVYMVEANATAQKNRLDENGIESWINHNASGPDILHEVVTGSYNSLELAKDFAALLKTKGYDSYVKLL